MSVDFTMFISFMWLTLSIIVNVICDNNCYHDSCIWRDWSEWSGCSRSCGKQGIRYQERSVLNPHTCPNGLCTENQTESCNERCCPENCIYTEWASWGESLCAARVCDDTPAPYEVCYRYRKMTHPASCGGYCPGTTVDYKCGHLCCYRDCVVSTWQEWGSCISYCEQIGVRNRTRAVEQQPQCGGFACPDLYEETECTGKRCPVQCDIGAWGSWGRCDVDCAEGNQTRHRFVRQSACSVDTLAEEKKSCYVHEKQNCQVT